MTEDNSLVVAEQGMPAVMAEEAADTIFSAGIALPTYDDTSDRKVLTAVKGVFHGFDYSDDDFQKFADINTLASYVQESIEEINVAKQMGDRSEVARSAAIAARFWYMSKTIDVALTNGNYGEGVVQKLSAQIKPHLAVSTIYAYRMVAQRLTPNDCWLLGTRGCKPTHLRKLAQIGDDDLRRGIMQAFVDEVTDTSDMVAMERARKQLVTACNKSDGPGLLNVATSDPTQEDNADAQLPSEYVEGMDTLRTLLKAYRAIADNDKFVTHRDTLGMVFVSESVPEAKRRVQDIKALAEEVKNMAARAQVNITDMVKEFDSIISGLEVTDENGDPVK